MKLCAHCHEAPRKGRPSYCRACRSLLNSRNHKIYREPSDQDLHHLVDRFGYRPRNPAPVGGGIRAGAD